MRVVHGVRQTVAIALNTFKETIRDRVLAVIVAVRAVMIVAGLWLGSISLGQQGRMMKDFGLVAVTGFGLIVAVFIAAGLVHKEVEKRTVFVLFSKPVSRAAFIAGKFLGLGVTMAVVVAGMGLFLFAVVWLVVGDGVRHGAAGTSLMIYVQLLTVIGGHHLLLDDGVGYPRQRARHLCVRRRAAQPQRALADAASGRTRSRKRCPGSCSSSSPTSRPSTSSRRGR